MPRRLFLNAGSSILAWVCRTTFAELAMILFTGALTWTAVQQWRLLHGQLDVMRNDQRAWMASVPGAGETLEVGPGSILRVPVEIANIGKTAAHDVTVEIATKMASKGDDPACEFGRPQSVARMTNKLILPGAKQVIYTDVLNAPDPGKSIGKPRIFSSEELKEMNEGRGFFIVYGRIRYKDIFDHLHWVHFCSHGTLTPRAVMITAGKCSGYNDLDEG